MLTAANRIKGP